MGKQQYFQDLLLTNYKASNLVFQCDISKALQHQTTSLHPPAVECAANGNKTQTRSI